MSEGYIKLHRQITEWEWYKNNNIKILFFHCLLRANHKDNKWQGITVNKGSFITSYLKLAQEVNLTEMQVRTALNKLKLTGEITCQSTSQYTIITINNWDEYQQNNTPVNNQITDEQQTDNIQITTNKNDKNVNNEKNVNNSANLFHKLTQSGVDIPEEFIPIIGDWLEYKTSRKQSYKDTKSIKAFINKLKKLSNNNSDTARQIVDESMANNWSGIFELRETRESTKSTGLF